MIAFCARVYRDFALRGIRSLLSAKQVRVRTERRTEKADSAQGSRKDRAEGGRSARGSRKERTAGGEECTGFAGGDEHIGGGSYLGAAEGRVVELFRDA